MMNKNQQTRQQEIQKVKPLCFRLRGSFTVEATVIVGLICIITGMMILLGMYCHDRVIMRQAADRAAADGAMWCGNYVSPEIKEVDYEKLKQMASVDVSEGITKVESDLTGALLLGRTESVSLMKTLAGQQVTASVTVNFYFAGRNFTVTEEGRAAVFGSLRFKRKTEKQGDHEPNLDG